MTNIQAIDLLKGLEQSLDNYYGLNDEGKTAFHMAITALELFGNTKQLPSAEQEFSGGLYVDGYNDGYRDGMKDAQPEQQWIPCSERLPEKHGMEYLVTISDGSVYSFMLQFDVSHKRWYLSFLDDDGRILTEYFDDVIAWMPLPEPYREERAEE